MLIFVMYRVTGRFVEELILGRKNAAASASLSCEQLRKMMTINGIEYMQKSESMDGESGHEKGTDTENLESPLSSQQKSGAGPLLYPGSSIHRALVALDRYHSTVANGDAHRWRMASSKNTIQNGNGVLPEIQRAAKNANERTGKREKAIMASQESQAEAESNLLQYKNRSIYLWKKVEEVENEVRQRVAEMVRKRSRERELRRKKEEDDKEAAFSDVKLTSTVTQQEIWELVANVGELGEDFTPTDLPTPSFHGPIDQAVSKSKSYDKSPEKEDRAEACAEIDDYRISIENELKLDQLEKAAIMNDEKVQDAAGALLNVISGSDTTKRSARVACEACLLDAANSEVACLKELVRLERESINERLRLIDELDDVIERVDVRSDLNMFIEHEKGELLNGSSKLGDNDDGGVASALAVLNSHGEGIGVGIGVAGMAELSSFSGWNDDVEGVTYDREELEDAVGVLFNESEDEAKFSKAVQFLTKAVGEKSIRARGYRASTCYAMNNYRGKVTQLKNEDQLDGMCKVLRSLLNGCDRESADIASAKMVMMLAQTFYIPKDDCDDRATRIYPKDQLSAHAIWLDEDFWVQALFQCVTDSLSNSGVMVRVRIRKSAANKNGKMKWHDLKPSDRTDAASQVHAVIFAQLGALAHSMVEFGCSVEKACHFVRRLSVRHQLPLNQRALLLQHLQKKFEV